MTPDRKLVEEIGRRICPHGDAYYAGPCEDCAEGVAHMVEVLRLVQLPEQSNGEAGTVECHPCGEPEYQHFVGQVVPIPDPGTPVYIIPGDPKEVDDG